LIAVTIRGLAPLTGRTYRVDRSGVSGLDSFPGRQTPVFSAVPSISFVQFRSDPRSRPCLSARFFFVTIFFPPDLPFPRQFWTPVTADRGRFCGLYRFGSFLFWTLEVSPLKTDPPRFSFKVESHRTAGSDSPPFVS